MTVGFIAATANGWLDTIRTGGSNYSAVTTLYIQLHTGDPGSAGTSNVSAGSTTRVAVNQNSPSGGSMTITGTLPEWTNGGTSETITHISAWSASSGGTCKYTAQLTNSKAWAAGDTLTLNTLTLALTPIAA